MAMDSPLYLTRVECPVCGAINEFETIRVGAYTEGERQTDFCPSVIKWRNPKYQKYHPLLFFTAACSNCFYTREFNNKFKEWGKDNNFRTYRLKTTKEKHLTALTAPDSIIKLIGGVLDPEQYPNETAILKLLLAMYDELLCEHPSHLDLGRFYLRVAWLFRQCGAGTEETAGPSPHTYVDDVERAVDDLTTWLAGLDRNIDYLNEAMIACNSHAAPEGEAPTFDAEQTMARLREIADDCRLVTADLAGTMTGMKKSAAETGAAVFSGPFHEYGSFGEFLVALRQHWDGVPLTEMQAVREAIKHYISAFENGKEIGHGNQAIQAAYLIAELSRRSGDHDTARQYFNTTIKMGQEFINEIKGDRTRTALARKILELALAQGKKNLAEAR
jgi:uncharacterized protein (DUF2225 family)